MRHSGIFCCPWAPFACWLVLCAVGAGGELGQPKDFAVGFLMGFFLGIIMLFWIWEAGPYRQKMGIMAGVSAQLGLR